ncbi:MAG: sigma factor-like helix-turn-helix DNA-binding protein [Candidatus Zixiibacteriota bacterium]
MTTRYLPRSRRKPVTPFWMNQQLDAAEREIQQRRIDAVQDALARLSPLEREIIIRVHFEGATLQEFARQSGFPLALILNSHRRALRRLRKLLNTFAAGEFKFTAANARCVICNSPHRSEIDKLLKAAPPGSSYREVMRVIRSRFNVDIVSVMTIIGHNKYHG